LALRLGYPHPDYLLEHLTSTQMTEWLAYNQISPISDQRGDIRNAVLASVVANTQGGKTKPEDFMPKWRPQTEDDILEVTKQITKELGGDDGNASR